MLPAFLRFSAFYCVPVFIKLVDDAPFKRTRYYMSSIDMSILEKGKPYRELPIVTMIYITKNDFIGDKRGCYQVMRKPDGQEVTMSLDNGLRERYFNLEYLTEDSIMNKLLRYFKHSDPLYRTENFPRIVERVKYFKIQKEGVNIMCEIADRIRNEGKAEGKIEGKIEGKREGKIESILELLEELDKIPQRMMEVFMRIFIRVSLLLSEHPDPLLQNRKHPY